MRTTPATPDPHETFSIPRAARLYGFSTSVLKEHIKNKLCYASPVKPGSNRLRVSRADMLALQERLAGRPRVEPAPVEQPSPKDRQRSAKGSSKRPAPKNPDPTPRFSGRVLSDAEAMKLLASLDSIST